METEDCTNAFVFASWNESGVISRGAQGGGAPLVKILDHFGGAQPPLEILALALLFKVYLHCFQSIFHCYAQLCIATWLLRHFYC